MARLVVEGKNRQSVVPLDGHVFLGSSSECQIVIDADGVSPFAASVCRTGDAYVLVPSTASTTLSVNGSPVTGVHLLHPGDTIQLGTVRLEFFADTPKPVDAGTDCIVFFCPCGTRLRASKALAGRQGTCKHCGGRMSVPLASATDSDAVAVLQRSTSTEGSPEQAMAEAVEETCSICQFPIAPFDSVTVCTACGLPFHRECWEENFGCAAFGCRNVDALKPGPDITVPSHMLGQTATPPPLPPVAASSGGAAADAIPWEFALLAASAVSALLAMFTFGLPSLAVAALAGLYTARAQQPRYRLLAIVWTVCGLALILGLLLSKTLYLD